MTTFKFELLNNYKNNGQNVEQSIRFALTGKIEKADNLEHTTCADCLNYQIKGARATVCKGHDLKAYLDMDASNAFIYASNHGIAYMMNRSEYEAFCMAFATVTCDSAKNGGGEKIRLKSEGKAMVRWLKARA